MNKEKYKELIAYFKDYKYFDHCQNQMLESVVRGMSSAEIEGLLCFCEDENLKGEIEKIKEKIDLTETIRRDKQSIIRHRNESFEELLALMCNKKSKRVQYARGELQKRFLLLSYDEQLRFMRLMLHGGKTERLWGYNILRNKWWSDEIKPDIFELWNLHKDCDWIFPRYFTPEEVRPIVSELCSFSNYYDLCKCLVKEEWFEIDKELLYAHGAMKYLYIMSLSRKKLTAEEAMGILNDYLVRLALSSIYKSSRLGIDLLSEYNKADYAIEEMFYISKVKSVGRMLTSICRMGFHDEVMKFLKVDKSIHHEYLIVDMGIEIPESIFCDDISNSEFINKIAKYIEFFLHRYMSIHPELLSTYTFYESCMNTSQPYNHTDNNIIDRDPLADNPDPSDYELPF